MNLLSGDNAHNGMVPTPTGFLGGIVFGPWVAAWFGTASGLILALAKTMEDTSSDVPNEGRRGPGRYEWLQKASSGTRAYNRIRKFHLPSPSRRRPWPSTTPN